MSSTLKTQTFAGHRLRRAVYDHATQQLDLHWENQSILAYKHVPEEVCRQLCSAPNPVTYWEDRIAEEYPKGTPMPASAVPSAADAAGKLGDLFGGGD